MVKKNERIVTDKKGNSKKVVTWDVYYRYKDVFGEKHQTTKRGFKTQREAVAWERAKLQKNEFAPSMTFEAFYAEYKDRNKENFQVTTWQNKESMISKYIIPYFGKKKMNEITKLDVITWLSLIQGMRKNDGTKLSQTTLRGVHNQLNAIFNFASNICGFSNNPCIGIKKIGSQKGKKREYWTLNEYLKVENVAKENPIFYYALRILYWTGIREGELLGLTTDSIDFETKTLKIDKSFAVVDGRGVLKSTKTEESNRVIFLPDFLLEDFKELLFLTQYTQENDRLFSSLDKRILLSNLKKYAEKAGVKTIIVHGLRHSHVSMLANEGFNTEVVAERLGHSNTEVTEIYSHIFEETKSSVAVNLDRIYLAGKENDNK